MICENCPCNEPEEGECSESNTSCSSQDLGSTQSTSDESNDDDERGIYSFLLVLLFFSIV